MRDPVLAAAAGADHSEKPAVAAVAVAVAAAVVVAAAGVTGALEEEQRRLAKKIEWKANSGRTLRRRKGQQQRSTKEKERQRERERGYTQKHRLGARTAGPSGLHGEAAGQHPDATHLYPTDSYGATRRAAGPQPTTGVNETGRRAQREQDSRCRPGTPSTGNAARPATGRKSLNWASSKRVEGGSLSGASCGAGHGTRPPESSAGKAAGWSGNRWSKRKIVFAFSLDLSFATEKLQKKKKKGRKKDPKLDEKGKA
ncbi:hypothetical protein TRV_03661, partial [Trichophyton verrucosum HKI 0517]